MQSLNVGSVTLIAGTGLAAGLVNAIAGGGSLISFPALVATGLPAVTANITNTVALCPGYFGGALAQRRDLVGQRSRVMMLLPTSLIGGVVGALLLLWTGEKAFDILVPFLLLFAVALLAFQNQLQAFMMARKHGAHSETWSIVPVGIAAIYGGYFGAALGMILIAVLSWSSATRSSDSMRSSNWSRSRSTSVPRSCFCFWGGSIGRSHS